MLDWKPYPKNIPPKQNHYLVTAVTYHNGKPFWSYLWICYWRDNKFEKFHEGEQEWVPMDDKVIAWIEEPEAYREPKDYQI